MSDPIDRAAELEALARAAALAKWREQQNTAPVSAFECEECGEPIPEARRLAVTGCRCCIDCQIRIEQQQKFRA
ncbi:MAG: TraR/DksA C4-type zinc finger protein [Neisseria sp.]|nr:TraR/DksA C4-type zinc finger protein [Neisseria sp.]